MSPALADGFLTSEPPGKSLFAYFWDKKHWKDKSVLIKMATFMDGERWNQTPLSIIFYIILIFDRTNILHIQKTKLIQMIKKRQTPKCKQMEINQSESISEL